MASANLHATNGNNQWKRISKGLHRKTCALRSVMAFRESGVGLGFPGLSLPPPRAPWALLGSPGYNVSPFAGLRMNSTNLDPFVYTGCTGCVKFNWVSWDRRRRHEGMEQVRHRIREIELRTIPLVNYTDNKTTTQQTRSQSTAPNRRHLVISRV